MFLDKYDVVWATDMLYDERLGQALLRFLVTFFSHHPKAVAYVVSAVRMPEVTYRWYQALETNRNLSVEYIDCQSNPLFEVDCRFVTTFAKITSHPT